MSRRILITGGAGFIGSHLVRECLRQDWQVAVLCRPETRLALIEDVIEKIQIYSVIGKNGEIMEIFDQFCPDLVFHLASVFRVKHTPRDIPVLVNSNILFGTQVLDAMAQYKVPYFVNTGTSWQHFENSNYNPVNLYAATKMAFEDILQYYLETALLGAITLKLFDTYGPGDPRPKLFNMLERTIRDKTRLEMSQGEQLIDIVYIDDVVNAFILAAKRLFERKVHGHEVYAVSSGQPIPLRWLVQMFEEIAGQKADIIWGARSYREREVMITWSRGDRLPGWKPYINLEQGIKKIMGS